MVEPIRFPTKLTMPPNRQVEVATIIILPVVRIERPAPSPKGRIIKINIGPTPRRKR